MSKICYKPKEIINAKRNLVNKQDERKNLIILGK